MITSEIHLHTVDASFSFVCLFVQLKFPDICTERRLSINPLLFSLQALKVKTGMMDFLEKMVNWMVELYRNWREDALAFWIFGQIITYVITDIGPWLLYGVV